MISSIIIAAQQCFAVEFVQIYNKIFGFYSTFVFFALIDFIFAIFENPCICLFANKSIFLTDWFYFVFCSSSCNGVT